jgi:hypothetical protein
MRCAVFRGIGGLANKYYLLFQHHLAPPLSTFTTGKSTLNNGWQVADPLKDAPETTSTEGVGTDSRQLENTYVLEEKSIDPSYIIGYKPGVSRFSLY